MAARRAQAPVLTIVGGQPPPRRAGAGEVVVPAGIEAVLRQAAADAGYRARLLARRAETLAGAALTGSERRILAAVPETTLVRMVERFVSTAEESGDEG